MASMVDRAGAGRAGVVWIEGEAGAGKTALLRAALGRLPGEFGVHQAMADERAPEVVLDTVGQLGEVTGGDAFGVGLELVDAVNGWQEAGPVAVVVEDLHWADPVSRGALLTMARRLDRDQVVVLVTSRPDGPDQDGWDRLVVDPDRCLVVRLEPLTVDEVVALAVEAGKPLAGPDAERLHRHTRGHALYVRTLLGELTLEQLTSGARELPAPRSLASTTLARMADLDPDARRLGAALAVLNRRCSLSLVGRVAGVDDPVASLDALLATGFVTWTPAEVTTPVEFVHPLYRTAVYDDLSPIVRQELHRGAARELDGEAALAHRVAAGDPDDVDLIGDLEAAARRTADDRAPAVAARHWLSASVLTTDPARADQLRLAAARQFLAAGAVTRAGELRDAIEAGQDTPRRSLVLGQLAWAEGDAGQAEAWLTDARTRDAEGSEDGLAALTDLGTLYTTQGRAEEAIDAGRSLLRLTSAGSEPERAGWITLALGAANASGAVAGLDELTGRLPADTDQVEPGDAALLATRGCWVSTPDRRWAPSTICGWRSA